MSTERRLRQDTAANLATVTPQLGEPAFDTTHTRMRWGDGAKQGGWPTPTIYDLQRQVGVFLTVEGSGSPPDYNTLIASTGDAEDGLAISALTAGMKFGFFWPGEHDNAVTLEIDAAPAADVELRGQALEGAEIGVGQYVEVVVDSSGDLQVITSGGGGVWEELASVDAAGDSVIDFTSLITPSHKHYRIIGSNVRVASDGALLLIRVSTNNGSSFISSGYNNSTGGASTSGIIASQVGSAAGEGCSFETMVFDPLSTAAYQFMKSETLRINAAGAVNATLEGAVYEAAVAVNALRILASTGNIASGNFKLLGLRA